jgi:hypothetical protein
VDAHDCQPMGVDSVRSEIRMSWRRAELVGVRPHEPIDRLAVGEVDESSRLMVAARPVLGEMADQLGGTRFCVLLGDGDCRIAHRWFDSPDVERALDNISAAPSSPRKPRAPTDSAPRSRSAAASSCTETSTTWIR